MGTPVFLTHMVKCLEYEQRGSFFSGGMPPSLVYSWNVHCRLSKEVVYVFWGGRQKPPDVSVVYIKALGVFAVNLTHFAMLHTLARDCCNQADVQRKESGPFVDLCI